MRSPGICSVTECYRPCSQLLVNAQIGKVPSSTCERAIDQIRPYFSLQRVVAPVPHMLQDQQSKRHFRRCLRPSTRTAIRMALSLRIVHTFDQRCVLEKMIYFFHPWFPQIFDVLCQSAVPQTWLPMSKLDHAASLISSDAAPTRKATLQHQTTNRKFTKTQQNSLYLRRKVARKVASLLINLGRSAYCVIVIVMLAPCGLVEPDEPEVEETVT